MAKLKSVTVTTTQGTYRLPYRRGLATFLPSVHLVVQKINRRHISLHMYPGDELVLDRKLLLNRGKLSLRTIMGFPEGK